jgi:hypothetical protein
VISKLASGLHPTSQEVIECQSLFGHIPYNIGSLSTGHVVNPIKPLYERKTQKKEEMRAT